MKKLSTNTSAVVEEPDDPNSLGNTPSIENITHTAIEKEVVKPEVRSSVVKNMKRKRSDSNNASTCKKVRRRMSNVVDVKEDSEIVAIGGTGLKSINSDVHLTSKGNARKESMHKKSNDNIEETGVAHQRQLVIVDKNKSALAKKK